MMTRCVYSLIALHLLSACLWVSHVEAEVLPTAKQSKKANVLLSVLTIYVLS